MNIIGNVKKSLPPKYCHDRFILFSGAKKNGLASQFTLVGSQIQGESRHVTVLNTARKMEVPSREDQKEENKEPTRKSSEIPTRLGDTSTGASVSDLKTSSFVPSDFLCLSVFSRSFVSSLLRSAELSRFTRTKVTPRRIFNAAVRHACRHLRLYSHAGSSALLQSVFPSRASKNAM